VQPDQNAILIEKNAKNFMRQAAGGKRPAG
jgi:hypothetical protein